MLWGVRVHIVLGVCCVGCGCVLCGVRVHVVWDEGVVVRVRVVWGEGACCVG